LNISFEFSGFYPAKLPGFVLCNLTFHLIFVFQKRKKTSAQPAFQPQKSFIATGDFLWYPLVAAQTAAKGAVPKRKAALCPR